MGSANFLGVLICAIEKRIVSSKLLAKVG